MLFLQQKVCVACYEKKKQKQKQQKNSTLFMKQRFIDTANDTPAQKKVLT